MTPARGLRDGYTSSSLRSEKNFAFLRMQTVRTPLVSPRRMPAKMTRKTPMHSISIFAYPSGRSELMQNFRSISVEMTRMKAHLNSGVRCSVFGIQYV